MFRHIANQVREIVGYQYTSMTFLILVVFAGITLLVLASRRRERDAGGVKAAFLRFFGIFCRSGFLIIIALFFAAMLVGQAGLYREKHGRVTQRNFNAVKSKWGQPQEQHEMQVTHYIWNVETIETFANGGDRRVVVNAGQPQIEWTSSQVLEDNTFTAKRDEKDKIIDPLQVVRRVKRRFRSVVPQDTIRSGNIDIDLTYTPRYLGGAGYAGFESRCQFIYTVANNSHQETRAQFRFPLPGDGYGLFNNLKVNVNGSTLEKDLSFQDGHLSWWRSMPVGELVRVEIQYKSRGLEYFRYWPGNMREQYLVTMHIKNLPRARLNFPIGSMSPMDDLTSLVGDTYDLHWDLSHAVTNFSIGILVPNPVQPGYELARILQEAPTGLLLLVFVLFFTRYVLKQTPHLLPLILTILMHYLGYTAFVHVSEHVDSFAAAISLGVLLPTAVNLLYWWFRETGTFAKVQAGALTLLFSLGYPLAISWQAMSHTILHTAYILLVGYVMFLSIYAWRKKQLAGGTD